LTKQNNLQLCEKAKEDFLPLLGKNIREFTAIMNHCDMIIGNDGGAINMAKALENLRLLFSPWIDKKVGLHLKTD
jgi:heptosyltransferase-2